eukprot:jgi/Tetstr1/431871/TSEL_021361.t1
MEAPGSSGAEAAPTSMAAADFKKQLFTQLHSSGVVNSLKSQLRTQMLAQLQARYAAGVQPPGGEAPSLSRRMLNSLIAEYLTDAKYMYTLSVFQPESGLSGAGADPLTADEILQVLHLSRGKPLFQALAKRGVPPALTAAPGEGGDSGAKPPCLMLELLESIKEVNDCVLNEASTQTYEEGSFRLGTQLQMLEDRFSAMSQEEAARPFRTLEERMNAYRREVDEKAKQDVAHQVERVRELEVSAVRLEEAAKYRRALEEERQELEKIHAERQAKLREREEAQSERLRRQQRDVEGAAFEHRQRIVREEDRLRAWKADAEGDVEKKAEALALRMEQVKEREANVAAREGEAERRHAEATELIAMAEGRARSRAREELATRQEEIHRERLALEAGRARLLEQRTECSAELSNIRSTQERLRAAVAAAEQAELRADAHKAKEETLKLQLENLRGEVDEMRQMAKHSKRPLREGLNADASYASLGTTFGHLLQGAESPRSEDVAVLKDALRRSEAARKRAYRDARAAKEELRSIVGRQSAAAEVVQGNQALLDQGVETQEGALEALEDLQLTVQALCKEVEELQASHSRMRWDLIQKLAAAGAPPEAPPPGAPKLSAAALQTLSDLDARVHRMRRDLDDYKHRVEKEHAETEQKLRAIYAAARPQDARDVGNVPQARFVENDEMPAPRVSFAPSGRAARGGPPGWVPGPVYGGQGATFFTPPAQDTARAVAALQLQQQLQLPYLPPHPAAVPPGFMEAIIDGQRVLVPTAAAAAAPGAVPPAARAALDQVPPSLAPMGAPPRADSPLQSFLAKHEGTEAATASSSAAPPGLGPAPAPHAYAGAGSQPQAATADTESAAQDSARRPLDLCGHWPAVTRPERPASQAAPVAEVAPQEADSTLPDPDSSLDLSSVQADQQADEDAAAQRATQEGAGAEARRREELGAAEEAERQRAAMAEEAAREAEAEARRREEDAAEEARQREQLSAVQAQQEADRRQLEAAAAARREEEERLAAERAKEEAEKGRRAAEEAERREAAEERRRAAEEAAAAAREAEVRREAEEAKAREEAEEAAAAAREAEERREAEEAKARGEEEEERKRAAAAAAEAEEEEEEKSTRLAEYRRKKDEQRRKEEEELLQALAEEGFSAPDNSSSSGSGEALSLDNMELEDFEEVSLPGSLPGSLDELPTRSDDDGGDDVF